MKVAFEKYTDYDLELERGVLGVCLHEPNAFATINGLLNDSCFYSEDNLKVYKTICNMWQQGHQIDLMSVTRRMYDKGHTELNRENTGYYLTLLIDGVVNGAHIKQWSMMLRELTVRRAMIAITQSGIGDKDPLKAAQDTQKLIDEALKIRSTDDWMDASMAAIKLTEQMDSKTEYGIFTGYNCIDQINGGFKPGQFIIIGARPAVGKSAFAGGLASYQAKDGHKIGFISLEMPTTSIFSRMVSSESGVPFTDIDKNRLDEGQRVKVTAAINKLATMGLYFSDTAQVTIHDIRAKAEMLKQRHGVDEIILDYLQLVEETDNKRNREQNISQISRGLKVMAMNLQIPVIALSQLKRDTKEKPSLSDLRESGALEQDADIVILLHRLWAMGILEENGESTANKAELIVAKWRNGATFNENIHFHGETMTFSEKQPFTEPYNPNPNPRAGIKPPNYDNEPF